MATKFKIEGLKELDDVLKNDFTKATSRNILRRALIKAGTPIAEDARTRAPRLTGQLQTTFGAGPKLSRYQKSITKPESDVEIYVGPGSLAQAVTQEFGTASHPAQPFMRPAWDANRGSVLKTFKEDVETEIDKAAQRAARKAARIAAKNARSA